MLALPPPGYSPSALNRQAMPNTLGQPGIQSAATQGIGLQGAQPGGMTPQMGAPAPGMSSFSPPSNMPAPQPMPAAPHVQTPPAAQRGQPWGVLGPQNLNGVVKALGGTKAR
jgi:hypothetical protein